MFKRLTLAVTAILISVAALSAQTADSTFERHNRWMIGADVVKSFWHDIGLGVNGIYGRQFSETVFLGVGFGAQTHMRKGGMSQVEYVDDAGNNIVKIDLPYKWAVAIPIYADLQVDFSENRSPFYVEVKAGGINSFEIRRVRGTESYNEVNWASFGETGIYAGVHLGKRFALNNGDEINISIGGNCIIGWGFDVPVSLGVRYGF